MISRTKQSVILCWLIFGTFFSVEAQQHYDIFVVQGTVRKEVLWNEDVLTLRKAPFYFEVHLYDMEGVYLSISSAPTYYNTPLKRDFVKPEYIGPMCQAEDLYNEDRDIIVDNEYFCYWYYDPKDSLYRFDRAPIKDGNHTKASMTVEKIYNPTTENTTAVSEFKMPLYLLFFNMTSKEGVKKSIMDRKKIKLVFGP